ncbi:MAG: imm11 family protein [Gemmobacter sp.]
MRYYQLVDDIERPNRWHLGGLIGFDGEEFTQGPMIPLTSPLRDQRVEVKLQVPGRQMDFTTTSHRSVPIVSFRVIKALSGLDCFTAFVTHIPGVARRTAHYILHIWDRVDCVDEKASLFDRVDENHPVRPDLAGQYGPFMKLVIDPDRAAGKDLFRLARAGSEIIASERVKQRFAAARVTGAVFQDVTPAG